MEFQLPWGTSAWLPEECEKLRTAETALRSLFSEFGGKEIATPTLVHAQTIEKGFGKPEKLFRVTDTDGSELVLRPELTSSAARLFATALTNEERPVKLYYLGQVFRQERRHRGNFREFRQAGYEIYGGDSNSMDRHIIESAASALSALGVDKGVIDIGHVGIVNALLDDAGITGVKRDNIRECLAKKDATGIREMKDASLFEKLLELGNDYSDFDKARTLSKNKTFQSALSELEAISSDLSSGGHTITFEFSSVSRIGYYTGMVFEGFVKGHGRTVIAGGRYDNLVSEFGASETATGFSLELERFLRQV